ncbi:MAG: glycerol kinase [Acetobacteraceae bacterium]|nr:glycerol kinase [Acetobacteraceae bacterium]
MAAPLILALDQGTSATKCALVDRTGAIVARGRAKLGEQHPRPGWVEQNAGEIWDSVRRAVADGLDGQDPRRVAAVGLSTQRESLVLWDRRTGEPLSPVISWQDQRTAAVCDALRSDANERLARERSGLPLDPMFSAAKATWLLDTYDADRQRARAGAICLGTVDSWLLGRLSGQHLIEAGNASRTQLLGVRRAAWDEALLDLFGVPVAALPRVLPSNGPFPPTRGLAPLADGTPVLAVMGDSHAALFAHGAFEPGLVKATYGTGSSVMGLAAEPDRLAPGLCLTIAWQLDQIAFAAEGNIRSAGSALVWMAALLGVPVDALVELGVRSESRGVVLVPGFGGLGAPWWDRGAVGLLSNLTLGTGRAELARAGLESIVQQVADVAKAIEASAGMLELRADGGPSGNDALMQMQADVLGLPVARARDAELSALGVAHVAGLGAGLWSWDELRRLPRRCDRFEPATDPASRDAARQHWRGAVVRAMARASKEDVR